MLLKKKMREERIGPLTGWKRVLYYTGRFFLFPLRRPIITLVICILYIYKVQKECSLIDLILIIITSLCSWLGLFLTLMIKLIWYLGDNGDKIIWKK